MEGKYRFNGFQNVLVLKLGIRLLDIHFITYFITRVLHVFFCMHQILHNKIILIMSVKTEYDIPSVTWPFLQDSLEAVTALLLLCILATVTRPLAVFIQLQDTHLIPTDLTKFKYLLSLQQFGQFSSDILS